MERPKKLTGWLPPKLEREDSDLWVNFYDKSRRVYIFDADAFDAFELDQRRIAGKAKDAVVRV